MMDFEKMLPSDELKGVPAPECLIITKLFSVLQYNITKDRYSTSILLRVNQFYFQPFRA